MDISVVIPVYNEEESIRPLYEGLRRVLEGLGKDYEVVFVEDGSTDRTPAILEEIQAGDGTAMILSMRKNFGKTAALAAGFDFARGDVIVTMDGDLQNDPADIPMLLEAISDCDLVNGWRKDRKDPFLTRKLPSMVANWLISTVTGVKLRDYGCGIKAYRRDVAKNLNLYGEMHRFAPAVASLYGVRIKEVAVRHHPRRFGRSKYGMSRTVRVLLDLITVRFMQSFSTRPIQFFGSLGLGSGTLGFLISLYLSMEKLLFGTDIGGRPLLLLGALLIIVGFQLIGMGLLGEMLARTYHESQRKPIYALKKVVGPKAE